MDQRNLIPYGGSPMQMPMNLNPQQQQQFTQQQQIMFQQRTVQQQQQQGYGSPNNMSVTQAASFQQVRQQQFVGGSMTPPQQSINSDLVQQLREQLLLWQEKYQALSKMHQQLRNDYDNILEQATTMQALASQSKMAAQQIQSSLKEKELMLDQITKEKLMLQSEIASIKQNFDTKVMMMKEEVTRRTSQASMVLDNKNKQVEQIQMERNLEKQQMQELYQRNMSELEQSRQMYQDAQFKLNQIHSMYSGQESQIIDLQSQLAEANQERAKLRAHNESQQRFALEKIDDLSKSAQKTQQELLDSMLDEYRRQLDSLKDGVETEVTRAVSAREVAVAQSQFSLLPAAMNQLKSGLLEWVRDSSTQVHSAMLSLTKFMQPFMSFAEHTPIANQEQQQLLVDSIQILHQYLGDLNGSFQNCLTLEERNGVVQDGCAKLGQRIDLLSPLLSQESNKNVGDEFSMMQDSLKRARTKALNMVSVDAAIMTPVSELLSSVEWLIKKAEDCQSQVSSSESSGTFYKKHHRWTLGFISAAKIVAATATMLVDQAEEKIKGKTKSYEALLVTCKEVSAATTQLVTASRVKSALNSKQHDALDEAGKKVKEKSNSLVEVVNGSNIFSEEIGQLSLEDEPKNLHDLKVKEMNQQVKIISLENQLNNERVKLAKMRQNSYHLHE